MFDYSREPVNDYFLIDMKSFYASVECIERNLDPMTTPLIVMSRSDNTGSGLTLASSPTAKKKYHITNVSRATDLPYPLPKELHIVPPRMNLYIKKNMEVNQIFRKYVADEDLLIYSIDESILKVTKSLNLFTSSGTRSERRRELAKIIKDEIQKETGLIATVGIGDNPLLAKLALDNEAKSSKEFIAEWSYETVPEKIWKINEMTDFWGIGSRMKKRLNHMGIMSIEDLANWNPYTIKSQLGVIGLQLYFHTNGIDRTDIAIPPEPTKEKSYGNSQVLPKDYTRREEVELVVKEMAEQVAIRIRQHNCKTGCVRLAIGTSILEEKSGFSHQMKIPITDNTKELQNYCLFLFNKFYEGQEVRHIGVTYSRLVYTDSLQLDLFSDPRKKIAEENLDRIIDKIRQKYGFTAIIHASSMLEGARSITRSTLIGGHAGGLGGLHND
ncbi:Y-family DNA polymerase [Enterococcus faecium]|nr:MULTISPECIES: Y-family DNA polymerase [Enterococcus]EKQ3345348.1 Y-family DNA polymerase [Enterococcus faecium]EKQ3703142.1 Y-family DNA polymerase [Enterococcus faecium]EKZ0070694.1 Y-family DNA polymerase [Enterococcus faecium]ELI7092901.1 Y-family DNA polymerase [Enterococcus faecium]EOH56844.1 DNA polymerase V [Enterococcus faecium EnGen0265]